MITAAIQHIHKPHPVIGDTVQNDGGLAGPEHLQHNRSGRDNWEKCHENYLARAFGIQD